MSRCHWCGAPHDVLPSGGEFKPDRCAWCGTRRWHGPAWLEQVEHMRSHGIIGREYAVRLLDRIPEYEERAPSPAWR